MAASLLSGGCSCSSGGVSRKQLPPEIVQVLEEGEPFKLYSLDPVPTPPPLTPSDPSAKTKDQPEWVQEWKAFGGAAITDANERLQLVAALKRGVEESDGTVAACFNPRHAIRAVHGGKTYDIVICFECLSATIYTDGQRSGSFLLTASPQVTFNASLIKAGVKLPE
jgi:hypothetical protein